MFRGSQALVNLAQPGPSYDKLGQIGTTKDNLEQLWTTRDNLGTSSCWSTFLGPTWGRSGFNCSWWETAVDGPGDLGQDEAWDNFKQLWSEW